MLCDSVAFAVVRTLPRAIPLHMITMRKSTHGFPFLSYMSMGLCLTALRAAGAPLLIIASHFERSAIVDFKRFSEIPEHLQIKGSL